MAKSNAERQAAYRQRHLKDVDGNGERLSLLVDIHAKLALERLARRYAVTQRAMLERLIVEADKAVKADMSAEQYAAYVDGEKGRPVTR